MIIKRLTLIIAVILAAIAWSADITAQRKVTPVEPPRPAQQKKPQPKPGKPLPLDRTNVEERLDANGNVILIDTITGLEVVDSAAIAARPKNLYPLITSVSVGVNLWDPLMRCLGQRYGIGDVWARMSFHNRYMPVVAVGFGNANITPDGSNFTWKAKAAPYLKLGMDYNVFYNNSPDYQLMVGARYGITHFSFDVTDITLPPGYWGPGQQMTIPSQSSTAGYAEFSLGVRVKLIGQLAAGWSFCFRTLLHESKCRYGDPMYIPGFGKRNQSVGGALSLIYTIPLNHNRLDKVDNTGSQAPASDAIGAPTRPTATP